MKRCSTRSRGCSSTNIAQWLISKDRWNGSRANCSAKSAAPASVAQAHAAASVAEAPPAARAKGDTVNSPMVGTVYLQPQPGADPFIKVGDTVTAGQTLFIIEAMKTMNPIPAPKGGRIVEILVSDAQPVEFGEPLAVIE